MEKAFTMDRSFRKGLREIKVKDAPEVREKIKEILGVTTKQSLLNYAAGKVKLDVVKASQIEDLFKSYGVVNCWGNE